MGPPIVAYLEAIDATLAPYGGRFIVHGNPLTRIEGRWPDGDPIVIAFPIRGGARPLVKTAVAIGNLVV